MMKQLPNYETFTQGLAVAYIFREFEKYSDIEEASQDIKEKIEQTLLDLIEIQRATAASEMQRRALEVVKQFTASGTVEEQASQWRDMVGKLIYGKIAALEFGGAGDGE